MVFWWTRKPLISARCIIAGALLDKDTDLYDFYRIVRLNSEKVPHRENPRTSGLREKFSKVKLLDPFAGFGSIPLEAIRLGIGEVVAIEFIPTAYVFLKAILEIPKWAVDKGLGEKLIDDVRKWGEWITQRLKEDPDIRELYDEDVAVYIGTWEVKCPFCNKYTPLIGNYWLARVKKGAKYERLAWMEPLIVNDRIGIKIIDLNKSAEIMTISENTVKTREYSYKVPEANINARNELARCLYCNLVMPGRGDQWYIKRALQKWNNKLEKYLQSETILEDLKQSPARPRLLVKIKTINNKLTFEPVVIEDDEKLWKALEKLRRIWGDPDIPKEPIPPYGHKGGGLRFPTEIVKSWYEFFNPRQLLTLVKLVKLIREAGKKIEQEKIKEGLSQEGAHKYAEAITTYLAIVLVRYVDFNSMVTAWNPGYEIIQHSLAVRGIAMQWNWSEGTPFIVETGTLKRNLENITKALKYLLSAVSGSSSKVRVLLDDATVLSKLDSNEKFDLIVTDPPYYDDVAYAELSDFYYVWLKRVLSDVENGMLKPRFYSEAFFECVNEKCATFTEIRTQWEKFAPLEVSVNLGRAEFFKKITGVEAGSDTDFVEKLGRAFKKMAELLKDDGLIVTYYAHTNPSAWEALIEAGWKKADLNVTSAYVIATESEQRVTARNKVALDASVVVVWRERTGHAKLLHEARREALEEASKRVEEFIKRRGATLDINLFLRSLSAILNVYTSYSRLIPDVNISELVSKEIFPLALAGLVEGVYRYVGLEKPLDPHASAYLVLKLLTRIGGKEEFRRGRVDRTFASLLGVFGGIGVDSLIISRVLARGKEDLELLEPEAKALTDSGIKAALETLLHEKGVDPSRFETFRTSIDILHYLELKALQLTSEQFRKLFEDFEARDSRAIEAIKLAKALYSVLPDSDPEKICCTRILKYLDLLSFGGFK
jgi:putative DNA methylase